MNNKKYYETDRIYIANALSFLGFRYYKFTNFQGKLVYSFVNSETLQSAVNKLFALKYEFMSLDK